MATFAFALAFAFTPWNQVVERMPPAYPFANPAAWASDVQDVVLLDEGRPLLLRLHMQIEGRSYRAVWFEAAQELFRMYDQDRNGVITAAEFRKQPVPRTFYDGSPEEGLIPRGASSIFDDMDQDQDEKVTFAEFLRYLLDHQCGPFDLHSGGNAGRSAEAITGNLFDLLDANHDKKLSKEELADAGNVLRKLDRNDDELITLDELDKVDDPDGGERPPIPVNLDVMAGRTRAGEEPSQFFVIHPWQSRSRIADALLKAYDKKTAKHLKKDDLKIAGAIFQRLDANKDGRLDAGELAKFSDGPADLELHVSFGKAATGDGFVGIVRPSSFAPAKENRILQAKSDGVMVEFGRSRLEMNLRLETTNAAVAAVRNRYLAEFKQADRDNNGYLDFNEARGSNFFRSSFRMLDADGDGKMFEKEMLAVLDRVQALQAKTFDSQVSLAFNEGMGLFDLLDLNHDGRLSARELQDAGRLIAEFDRDGDGQIGRFELPRRFQLMASQGGKPDGNFAANRKDAAIAGPLWFRKMDRNHDGYVSRKEFLGPPEKFELLDQDHDGFISPAEAEKAEKLFAKKS